MTTADKAVAGNPWQQRVLAGSDWLGMATKKPAAFASSYDPPADDLCNEQPYPGFLPHYLLPPDGKDWS